MLHKIITNPINIVNFYGKKVKEEEPKIDSESAQKDSYITNTLDALATQNMAFVDDYLYDKKGLPQYDKSIVADEPEGHFSFYLRNNPEEFYLRNGFHINKFLRTGKLDPINKRVEDVSDIYKPLVAKEVAEKKDYNKAIVDSVEIIDTLMESKTNEDLVVYKYSPKSWIDSKSDGKLIDRGFFSATTVKGSLKDAYVDKNNKTCFEVWIPKGTPFLDLTDRGQFEMLFPRNCVFDIIDDNSLELISYKKNQQE